MESKATVKKMLRSYLKKRGEQIFQPAGEDNDIQKNISLEFWRDPWDIPNMARANKRKFKTSGMIIIENKRNGKIVVRNGMRDFTPVLDFLRDRGVREYFRITHV